jgi:hypothetical protein
VDTITDMFSQFRPPYEIFAACLTNDARWFSDISDDRFSSLFGNADHNEASPRFAPGTAGLDFLDRFGARPLF